MDQNIIIAVNSGVGLRVIDSGGRYSKEISDAKHFADEIAAYEYIEKHGLEKMASVRVIKG